MNFKTTVHRNNKDKYKIKIDCPVYAAFRVSAMLATNKHTPVIPPLLQPQTWTVGLSGVGPNTSYT